MHIPEEESTRNAPSPSYFNHETDLIISEN